MKWAETPAEKRRWILGAAFFCFLVISILEACRGGSATASVDVDAITLSPVETGHFQEFMSVTGTVHPFNSAYLDASEGGKVEKIYVEAGAMVKKDQTILELSNINLLLDIMWKESDFYQQSNNLRSTRLAMEQYRLKLSQDLADIENQLQQQKRLYERYAELIKDDLISRHTYELSKDQYEYLQKKKELTIESQKKELEFRQNQVDALESSLQRLQANLDIAREKLQSLIIKAPVDGRLTSLRVEMGQSLSPGQRIGQIDVLSGFKVTAAVDEKYLARVGVGLKGEFNFAGRSYTVLVKKIYPEVHDEKFDVDLDFSGREPEGITRGQTLHIQLELGGPSEVLCFANGPFYGTSKGNWVFVLDAAGDKALKRKIKTGREDRQCLEVLRGLALGEKVITSSYEKFANAETVFLKKLETARKKNATKNSNNKKESEPYVN